MNIMKNIHLRVKIDSTIPEEELTELIQYQASRLQDYFLKDCRTDSCDVSIDSPHKGKNE